MLDNLTQRLSRVVKTIRGEARLTEANTQDMLREVRMALLEADVALPVVREFIARVKEKALGQEVADSLNPGQALVNIESLDQLKVDFRIPEVHAHLIAVNQTIQVRVDALPGKSFEGKVYAMDPAFDPGGRAAILRARLPNPNKQLNPGMFARVSLIVEDRANAVLVPETALVPVGNDIFAFRVIDGKAVMTKLRIGLRRAGEVEVLEGLSASDQIIAEGGQKIRDGQYVRASEIRGS